VMACGSCPLSWAERISLVMVAARSSSSAYSRGRESKGTNAHTVANLCRRRSPFAPPNSFLAETRITRRLRRPVAPLRIPVSTLSTASTLSTISTRAHRNFICD
jgi:hypothetical protein